MNTRRFRIVSTLVRVNTSIDASGILRFFGLAAPVLADSAIDDDRSTRAIHLPERVGHLE